MDAELRRARKDSRDRNVELLHSSGFRRIGPSNVFRNNDEWMLLSPGVGAGEDGTYLFDIRVATLDKLSDPSKAALLLRLEPDWFAFVMLETLQSHLTEATLGHGTHSGPVYRFSCRLDESARTVTISSTQDPSVSFSTELLDRDEMIHKLARIAR